MRVSGSQSCAQKNSIPGEAKQRTVADLLEATVEDFRLLVSVDGIFGGIYVNDEPPLVSAPKQGIGGSTDGVFARMWLTGF